MRTAFRGRNRASSCPLCSIGPAWSRTNPDAPGGPVRRCRLPDVGTFPAVLAAAGAGRCRGDPRPPDGVVARGDEHRGHGIAPVARDSHDGRTHLATGDRRVDLDLHQLGCLHLRGEQRAGGRRCPRVLHQPAGQCPARRCDLPGAAHQYAVGRGRTGRGGSAAHCGRRRRVPLDRGGSGGKLRALRTRQEGGPIAADRVADRRGNGLAAPCAGLLDVPPGAGLVNTGRPRQRSRRVARPLGSGDRAAAVGLCRRRAGPAALHPRTAPVHDTRGPVPDRNPLATRTDVGGQVGRFRADLAGAGAAVVRRPAAGSTGQHRSSNYGDGFRPVARCSVLPTDPSSIGGR